MVPVLLLDGGFSNELAKRCSYDVDKDPLWTAKSLITDPEAVTKTHLAYLQAGADIIETATYQATISGLHENLKISKEECESLIEKSAELARKAVDEYVSQNNLAKAALIAGSIGPYGVYLHDGSEYSGSYMDTVSMQDIIALHSRRIEILLDKKVDLLALETMPSLAEVEILLEWLNTKQLGTTKVWVSFVLDTNDHTKTVRGDSIKHAFKVVSKYSFVWGFGANCVNPASISPFLRVISATKEEICEPQSEIKLMAYPNIGRKWTSGKGWSDEDVPSLSEYAQEWVKLGANVIGGCCQVGADEIKKLRSFVDKWNQTS